jgi:hypothetical protein
MLPDPRGSACGGARFHAGWLALVFRQPAGLIAYRHQEHRLAGVFQNIDDPVVLIL